MASSKGCRVLKVLKALKGHSFTGISNKELAENKDRYYCVGISLGTPKFPLGYTVEQQCYSLAPKGYML